VSGYQYLPSKTASHRRRHECEKIKYCISFLFYLDFIICPNGDAFCIVHVLGDSSEKYRPISFHPELSCYVSDLSAFNKADQNNVSEMQLKVCLITAENINLLIACHVWSLV